MRVVDLPAGWPAPVRDWLAGRFGAPLALEPLSGIARSTTTRVRFAAGEVIVKWSASPAESRFYTRAAPALRQHGVPSPELYLSHEAGETWWLVLEAIPRPLPRDRWLADPAVLVVLRRLHESDLSHTGDYRPAWPKEMTEAALASFAPAEAARARERLLPIRERCLLLQPRCPISGDPNPTNWGLRADGSPVLFDWERFGRGTPALDLAITVPGFGDGAAFRRVADGYARLGPGPDWRDLAAAKAWSAVELLASLAGDGGDLSARLVPALRDWLERIDVSS